jgi:multisubunit Na+/H+ antiporter MnhE subunit
MYHLFVVGCLRALWFLTGVVAGIAIVVFMYRFETGESIPIAWPLVALVYGILAIMVLYKYRLSRATSGQVRLRGLTEYYRMVIFDGKSGQAGRRFESVTVRGFVSAMRDGFIALYLLCRTELPRDHCMNWYYRMYISLAEDTLNDVINAIKEVDKYDLIPMEKLREVEQAIYARIEERRRKEVEEADRILREAEKLMKELEEKMKRG